MMQRVHNLCYLATKTLNLEKFEVINEPYFAVAVPKGAEIVNVHVEVVEKDDTGAKLNIGLLSNANFFMNQLDLSKEGHHTSAVQTKVAMDGVIQASVTQQPNKGKAILRVMYFLPSQIMTEH